MSRTLAASARAAAACSGPGVLASITICDHGRGAIAPDQRGYGGTTGWDGRYDGDYAMFRTHSYALDATRLVFALGHRSIAALVGHDFGSMIAAYCALARYGQRRRDGGDGGP